MTALPDAEVTVQKDLLKSQSFASGYEKST